jgi:hypothetical protein
MNLPQDLIFKEGFENGDLSAWSASMADPGDLTVTPSAALVGGQGLQVRIDDNTPTYLVDNSPNTEPRYRLRYYFDPNSITMANGDIHGILYGYSGSSTPVLLISFRYSSGTYQIQAGLMDDGATWSYTGWFTISDAPHSIEVDWKAASADGANDGSLTFWIDGVQKSYIIGVDNDTRQIDSVRLGAVAGIDSGTRGSYFFDAFESRRLSYIGMVSGAVEIWTLFKGMLRGLSRRMR